MKDYHKAIVKEISKIDYMEIEQTTVSESGRLRIKLHILTKWEIQEIEKVIEKYNSKYFIKGEGGFLVIVVFK